MTSIPEVPWDVIREAPGIEAWARQLDNWLQENLPVIPEPFELSRDIQDALTGNEGQPSITNRFVTEDGLSQATATIINNTTVIVGGSVPLTTRGDLLTRDGAGNNIRLGIGAAGKYVRSDGNDPSWQTILSADISNSTFVTSVAGTATRISSSGGLTPTIDLITTAVAAATYGSATQVGQFTVDAYGRLAFAANVTIALDASAITSGTLAIARGGTNSGTALGAFNNLSPLTTRGDMLTRDASNNIRVAIGTAGKYWRTDGTDPSWQTISTADITTTLTGIVQGTGSGALTGITGTTNYIPKWSATAPYLTATSRIFDNGSNVGIGTALPGAGNTLHIVGSGGENASFRMTAYGADASVDSRMLWQRANGTEASPTIVSSGDKLRLIFQAYDGVSFKGLAEIRVNIDGTPAANDMPGRLGFFTTPAGSVSQLERLRIDNAGEIIIATALPLCWGSSGATTPDLFLYRNSANWLEQYNSTNNQSWSLYGTRTDASNYERLTIKHNASATGIVISTDALGTGTKRAINFQDQNTKLVTIFRSTGWTLPTGTASKSGFDTSTGTLTNVLQTIKAIMDHLMTGAGFFGT